MYKNKQLIKRHNSKLLRLIETPSYNAYKKMISNSSSSTQISTYNHTDLNNTNNWKATPKYPKKFTNSSFIKPCSFQIVHQPLCPFGFTEKRFKWQNLNDKSTVVNPNDKGNKIKRIKKQNSFDGGFLKFYDKSTLHLETNKPIHFQKRNVKTIRKAFSQGCLTKKNVNKSLIHYDSQRVIHPEKNNEKEPIECKKRFPDKNFIYTTGSTIQSLLDKTPLNFEIKGKRRYSNHSFGEESVDLFSEDYSDVLLQKRTMKKMFNKKRNTSNEVKSIAEIGEKEIGRKKGIRCSLYYKYAFY